MARQGEAESAASECEALRSFQLSRDEQKRVDFSRLELLPKLPEDREPEAERPPLAIVR